MEQVRCKACDVIIQEFRTGKKQIDSDYYCDDCYYDDMSKLIEEVPIGVFPSRCLQKH
jgi:hypothetical protein